MGRIEAEGGAAEGGAAEGRRPIGRGRSGIWLMWGVFGGALVIVVVAVAVAIDGAGVRRFPDGSPERVVQQFVDAMLDGDRSEARVLIDPASSCWLSAPIDEPTARVVLVRTEVDGASARVELRLTQVRGFLIEGVGEEVRRARFELRQTTDMWRIVDIPPLFGSCSVGSG